MCSEALAVCWHLPRAFIPLRWLRGSGTLGVILATARILFPFLDIEVTRTFQSTVRPAFKNRLDSAGLRLDSDYLVAYLPNKRTMRKFGHKNMTYINIHLQFCFGAGDHSVTLVSLVIITFTSRTPLYCRYLINHCTDSLKAPSLAAFTVGLLCTRACRMNFGIAV